MDKRISRKQTLLTMLFIIGLAVLVLFRNEGFVKNLSVIAFLVLAASTLAANIEKSGVRELIVAAGPMLLNIFPLLAPMGFVPYLTKVLNAVVRWLPVDIAPLNDEMSLTITFWLFFALMIVLGPSLFNRLFDDTGMGRKQGADDPDFKVRGFREKNAAFCITLRQRLERLNRETDWHESAYVPLEAEVEALIKNTRRKRYRDMLSRLKRNRRKNTVYLVLGAPGSGKSVSLRKLCLDLLNEVEETKKTPVYINLKDWNENWSPDRLPELKDLEAFVKQSVYGNGDHFSDNFLNDYYEKMLDYGKWYFVFDSFDEMPCLMAGGNCREVIDRISGLLYEFLTGANKNGGIIASRLFNAPSEALQATETLRIQDFDDNRIQTMLRRYLKNTTEIERTLFTDRKELVSLCRNPFYLTLLVYYLETNNRKFPENQKALYENFIKNRLQDCSGKIKQSGTTVNEIYIAARELALSMQHSISYGLEYPVEMLLNQSGKQEYWLRILNILEYVRLIRRDTPEGCVSFVHRRFQEFFLVENMMGGLLPVGKQQYEDILQNTGLRDALVLYSEVADLNKAQEIAYFCWDVVRANLGFAENALNDGGMKLINALYFLKDAFQNRKDAIATFISEFEDIITLCLEETSIDFVVQLAMIRCTALFDEDHLQKAALLTFHLENQWLNAAIAENCWQLKKLSNHLVSSFFDFFDKMGWANRMKKFRGVYFSLSLSRGFRWIKLFYSFLIFRDVVLPLFIIVNFIPSIFSLMFLPLVSSAVLFPLIRAFPERSLYFVYIYGISSLNISLFWVGKPWKIIVLCTNFLFFMIETLLYFMRATSRDHRNQSDFLFGMLQTITDTMRVWFSFGPFLYSYQMGHKKRIEKTHFTEFIPVIVALAFLSHSLSYFRSNTALRDAVDFIVIGGFIRYYYVEFLVKTSFYYLHDLILVFLKKVSKHLKSIFGYAIYVVDKYKIFQMVPSRSLSRQEVKDNLDSLRTAKGKFKYVESLINSKVKLTGNWPDDHRPKCNEDVDRLLAILDTANIKAYTYRF